MMGARCECERPLVFRGQETCLKCGHTAREPEWPKMPKGRNELADRLAEMAIRPSRDAKSA